MESFAKDVTNYDEYPQSADILHRCVSMLGRLFHTPVGEGAVGTSVVGTSEAIMLSLVAMKIRWRNRRKAGGYSSDKPNIVMSSAAHPYWAASARYFDIEEKYIYCTEDRYVIDPQEAVRLVDENTIGICCVLGTTYTGEYEDVRKVNALLAMEKLEIPIHVDADSGGFVAPFIVPDLKWDFRKLSKLALGLKAVHLQIAISGLENVVSINVSGHKACELITFLETFLTQF